MRAGVRYNEPAEGSEKGMAIDRDQLERTARDIFGDDPRAIARWADYWGESSRRNQSLLEDFRPLALIDFQGKQLLDVGCGCGGLAETLAAEKAEYVGLDYHRHVLQLASPGPGCSFLQASGTRLPFRNAVFDYVAAFDVIEHLVGGYGWQVRFLRELRRVLRPLGMILLTTPNRWYPYEAHSELYGPQYLPLWLADRYIGRRNPSFLREHNSFAEIQMLTPRRLRRALGEAGLSWLHDLPCGLDKSEYRRLFPLRGLLTRVGLGWYPHAEFWGILVRRESREDLRLKRPQHWFYVQNQPSGEPASDFQPVLDFDRQPFGHQLGPGWHWHERDRRGFRWTSREAEAYLQAPQQADWVELEGFSPQDNRLEVLVDGWKVGERRLEAGRPFRVLYLLPFDSCEQRIHRVTLRCRQTLRQETTGDTRELGVMVFWLGLAA